MLCRKPGTGRDDGTPLLLDAFPTPLGWCGILGQGETVHRIYIAQSGPAAVEDVCRQESEGTAIELAVWNSALVQRLIRFTEGEETVFDDVRIRWPQPLTEFRRRVIARTRQISWGETLTYAEVAQRAGSPRAARAVGTAMATNLFPLVIPCHRVVGSQGRLGGFSAPGGPALKRQLLRLESTAER